MSGTLEDSITKLRDRIKKQKAWIGELNRRIALPEDFRPTIWRNGPSFRPTKGRAHLIEECLHQEEILADLQQELDRRLLELGERNRRFHPIQGDEPTNPATPSSATAKAPSKEFAAPKESLTETDCSQPKASDPRDPSELKTTETCEFAHDDEYRSVSVSGVNYTLTPNGARIIQTLDRARVKGQSCSRKQLIGSSGTPTARLRDSFKNGPGKTFWKKFVARTGKDMYRMNLPTTP